MKKIIVLIIFLFSFLGFLSAEWTVVETYTIPGKASGLAWDGTYLYFGIYGSYGDHIYRFDPQSETNSLQFINEELDDSFGMTWDGTSLWITHHPSNPASAVQLDLSGNILSQFSLPDQYMSGIAFDGINFWVSTYYPDDPSVIYQVDNTGAILNQFNFDIPDNNDEQPWDLCIHEEDLWLTDYNENTIYKVDTAGNILENYSCENIKPAGIVFDGSFLWYVDGPLSSNSTLYKVDLGGAGTPQISLDWEEYDFGNTTIGVPETIELSISNTGDADLEVTDLDFTSQYYSSDVQLPLIIPSGEISLLNITFSPVYWGEEPAQLFITSNDPVDPEVMVTLSGYGVHAEQEIVLSQISIYYSDIRAGAVTGKFIEISNQGLEQLIIDDLQFVSEVFFCR